MGFLDNLTRKKLRPIRLTRTTSIPELKIPPLQYTLLNKLINVKITPEEYSIFEPELSNEEKNLYHLIEDSLIEIIDIKENTSIDDYLEKALRIIISELNIKLTETSMQKLIYYSYKNIIGLRVIQPLLEDPLITSIEYNKELKIKHKLFNIPKINLQLTTEELYYILRKISLKANKELSLDNPKINVTENKIDYSFNFSKDIEESTFTIKRLQQHSKSPIELIKNRKCSPEIMAFLWLLIEDHNNIFFINNITYLQTLSYFLPPHTKIFTNITSYLPNINTTTIIGTIPDNDEDFAIIQEYKGQYMRSTLLASIDTPLTDTITCEIADDKIISIKESQKELFKYSDEKFLFSLEESQYIRSKGNKAILIEEFKFRTKLLHNLSKTNITNANFLKIIYAYYENPEKVLQKAKLI
jgi:hypothetical protein